MIYQFKCTNKDCECVGRVFEERQPMDGPHIAVCQLCGVLAQRIYGQHQVTWPGALFEKDGSKMDEGDIPRVYTGHNKFFSGFGKRVR